MDLNKLLASTHVEVDVSDNIFIFIDECFEPYDIRADDLSEALYILYHDITADTTKLTKDVFLKMFHGLNTDEAVEAFNALKIIPPIDRIYTECKSIFSL